MAIPTTVDPMNIPKSMTADQLEWWILFGICVANKPAKITETKLKSFFNIWAKHVHDTPFETVAYLDRKGTLEAAIKQARFGQYKRITRAFREAAHLDSSLLLEIAPRAAVELLEGVYGIGPKTARMIVLYANPEADCVPLDTHVLKFLKTKGYNVPKSTPSAGLRYNELEKAFQKEAAALGKTVRELDTEVWLSYAKKA